MQEEFAIRYLLTLARVRDWEQGPSTPHLLQCSDPRRPRAKTRNLDLVYRRWKDSFAMRLWALRRDDPGNYKQGHTRRLAHRLSRPDC
jgi:hypothetical protein